MGSVKLLLSSRELRTEMSDLKVCPSELGLGRSKDHSLTSMGNGVTHLKSQETEVGRSV